MEDLPVFEYGCDSSYSWSKKYAHLVHQATAEEICDRLETMLTNKFNPNGRFLHPKSGSTTHLAFTGGEPIMSQNGMLDVLQVFLERGNFPTQVTVETNGTQKLREPLMNFIQNHYNTATSEWFWSCSPKLSTSGELWKNAIKPEILSTYNQASPHGQLKFVVDGQDDTWDEVDRAIELYRKQGIDWMVSIMPVGARKEEQQEHQARICEEAVARGYHFSARVHCFVFDNVIGK